MQLGMIGLGRMGANMVRRLMKAGHQCVVFDMNPASVKGLASEGATGAGSIDEFLSKLKPPRHVWLMVPAAVVDSSISQLAPKMQNDDVLIDGGNSYYIDDIRRQNDLRSKGIHYLDVGTSGESRCANNSNAIPGGGGAHRHVAPHPDPPPQRGEGEVHGSSAGTVRGISPHAPYSVHRDLYRDLVKLASEVRAPVAAQTCVTVRARAVSRLEATAEPALKPNQPTQSRPAPRRTRVRLFGEVESFG